VRSFDLMMRSCLFRVRLHLSQLCGGVWWWFGAFETVLVPLHVREDFEDELVLDGLAAALAVDR